MNAKIILRKERVYSDGKCPFALCVTLGKGGRVVLGLGGISAKPSDIDTKGFIRGRDQLAKDTNMELQRQLSRANEILIKARLANIVLDAESFKAEWATDGGSQDFIRWSEKELQRQLRVKLIGYRTGAKCKTVLERLKRFAPEGLRFSQVTQSFLEEFDAWYRREASADRRSFEDGRAARIKAMRVIRKFLFAATRVGAFNGKNPFGNFKIPQDRQALVFLTRAELSRIRCQYDAGNCAMELRPFLFACYTGLRFSDVAELQPSHMVGGRIKKVAVKGAHLTPRELDVPITRLAQELIDAGGFPMVRHTDQHLNRTLKAVAVAASIPKKVTFHTSRHTFATLFLEAGGSVEVLRELLGHASLKTTMVYVHVAGERKVSQMAMMDRLLE